MKTYLLIFVFMYSTILKAQVHPGGGQLDPTKKNHISYKEIDRSESKFFRELNKLINQCDIEFKIKPETYAGFYDNFKDITMDFDPNIINKDEGSKCLNHESVCLKKIKQLAYQCLIQDKKVKNHFQVLVNNEKEFKKFLKKNSKDSDTIFNFYKLIVYGKD